MGAGFLKKGKAAHAAMDKAEAATEAKKAANSGPRRFWIPEGKETQITFLDGDLDDDGMMQAITFWEHGLKLNGKWGNFFLCTQVDEPCPICEGGDDAYIAAVFTIIDHGEWKDGKGVVHKNERKLFVAKRETFRRLQKIAAKRGGLTGVTFDVARTGDKSPNVGSEFDFVEKLSLPQLKKKYGLDDEGVSAFDYDKAFTYREAKTLRKMGFGAGGSGPIGQNEVDTDDDGNDDDMPAPSSKAGKGAKGAASDYADDV